MKGGRKQRRMLYKDLFLLQSKRDSLKCHACAMFAYGLFDEYKRTLKDVEFFERIFKYYFNNHLPQLSVNLAETG